MRTSRSNLTWTLAVGAALFVGALAIASVAGRSQWWDGLLRNPLAWGTRLAPSGPVVVRQIQQLRRLETCRYQGQVIVRGDTGGLLPRWLAGDRLLFVGQGEVIGGVDLAQLQDSDVRVDGKCVSVRLPRSEVLVSRLDNRTSEVCDRQTGLLTGPDRSLEGRVRLTAEEQLREAALSDGLLGTASANARSALEIQLRQLGFEQIRFL